MNTSIPTATHVGDLQLEGTRVPCAVLPGPVRVLQTDAVHELLGLQLSEAPIPLSDEYKGPIAYKMPDGSCEFGYRAELVSEFCVDMRIAWSGGELAQEWKPLATKCGRLCRIFMFGGVRALAAQEER